MKWWLSRARGCQSGTGASSSCLLSFFLSLSHASVLFCLFVPGVCKRQTNRCDCLLLPVGWWSASLTSHYLALGYSDSYVYYSCISPHGFIFLIQCPLKQKTTLTAHTHLYKHTSLQSLSDFFFNIFTNKKMQRYKKRFWISEKCKCNVFLS